MTSQLSLDVSNREVRYILSNKQIINFRFYVFYQNECIFFYRYLGWLKRLVRNRARPEASIAENYVANECMEFASRFISGAQMRHEPDHNIDANEFASYKVNNDYSRFDLEQAHAFILNNLEIFEEYRT